jgi:hypothetical protein
VIKYLEEEEAEAEDVDEGEVEEVLENHLTYQDRLVWIKFKRMNKGDEVIAMRIY